MAQLKPYKAEGKRNVVKDASGSAMVGALIDPRFLMVEGGNSDKHIAAG